MKRLTIDVAVCSGCRACEITCAAYHEGKFGPKLTRIRVVKREEIGLDSPVACRQCQKAPCIDACPTGALTKHPQTGAIRVSEADCVGCGLCVDACVNGSMSLHPDTSVAMACDLCGGDPKCVTRCATGALEYAEIDVVAQRKRERATTSSGQAAAAGGRR